MCAPIHLPIYPSIHLPICPFTYPPIDLSTFSSHLSISSHFFPLSLVCIKHQGPKWTTKFLLWEVHRWGRSTPTVQCIQVEMVFWGAWNREQVFLKESVDRQAWEGGVLLVSYPPNLCTFSSFRSQLKCHLLRESCLTVLKLDLLFILCLCFLILNFSSSVV